MKVRVINKKESVIYKCEVHRFGDEFEMDSAIAKNLIEREFIEVVDEEAEVLTGHLDKEQLAGMPYKEVQKLAKDIGVDASGKKEEIIERIIAQEVELPFSDIVDEGDEVEEGIEVPNTNMPD